MRTLRVGLFVLCATVTAQYLSAAPDASPRTQAPWAYFNGDWKCAGEFPSNGKKISSTLRFAFNANAGVLIKQHDDDPPSGYHAEELWGFDHGTYKNVIEDPFGGMRIYVSPGWAADTLTWTNATASTVPNATGETKVLDRFSYTRLGSATMRIDWEVSRDDAPFKIGDTLTCNRV